MIKNHYTVLLFLISLVLAACSTSRSKLDLLKLPKGFEIEFFAENLPNARTMVLGDEGTVFVGTRTAGNVYAVKDGKHFIIGKDMNMPNGLAFHNKALYVAVVDQILRFDDIENNLANPPEAVIIRDDLPDDSHHGWRFIAFGPDGRLYISIGAPCNICLEEDYAQIRSMNADGSDERVEAKGVRNSVGFTWHPSSKKLWFSDNGRDWLGDDSPPDEINLLEYQGQHFGFPYCHGGIIQDSEFNQKTCDKFSPPIWPLEAHVAPLGIAFYTGKQFPKEYHNQLFVAEHGSWNSSEKKGYRIMMGRLVGENIRYETFISGWLKDDNVWGRPAYLLVLKDGSLLISDDQAGAIYRLIYKK